MLPAKPKFRSRKLDFKKALPIRHAKDLPDLDEDSSLNRAVPMVATGVEKEEEEEHHLQAVISAAQVRDAKSSNVYIPTPDASILIDFYHEHYNRHHKMPTNLIRFSNTVEDCIGSMYCMNESDAAWLEEFNSSLTDVEMDGKDERQAVRRPVSEDDFERIVSELEKLTDEKRKEESNDKVLASLEDLDSFLLLEQSSSPLKIHTIVVVIYDYWNSKRADQKALLPRLKIEENPTKESDSDPFLCFRKREIRTTRKTRRTDAQSLQKLRQLRSELMAARSLLDMVTKREKLRKESLLLDHLVFEQRILARSMTKRLGLPSEVVEEAKAQRKRALKLRVGSPSPNHRNRLVSRKRKVGEVEEYEAPKDPITLSIENEVHKRRLLDVDWEDLTDCPCIRFPPHPAHPFIQNELLGSEKQQQYMPHARYRRGRGGRLWIDRRPRSRHAYPSPAAESPVSAAALSKWKYDDFEDCTDEENLSPWSLDVRQLDTVLKLIPPEDMNQLRCKPMEVPVKPPSSPKSIVVVRGTTTAATSGVNGANAASGEEKISESADKIASPKSPVAVKQGIKK